MKKAITTTTLLILLSLNLGIGQTNINNSIWYAAIVHDTLGNPYPEQNIERFMYFENQNNISTLSIDQKTSMSTGETIVSYSINANNLAQIDESNFKVKEYTVDNFTIINADSIYYREKFYHVGFKRLEIERSKHTQEEYLKFLLDHQVREYYDNGENLNQLHNYKKDGNKEIDVVDSPSSWESAYRIFSFEGFVFLRGITTYPILLTKMNKNMIMGTEVNRKKSPLKTEIRIE